MEAATSCQGGPKRTVVIYCSFGRTACIPLIYTILTAAVSLFIPENSLVP